MGKNKPRWKDLTTSERLIKKAKRMNLSESTINTLKKLSDANQNKSA